MTRSAKIIKDHADDPALDRRVGDGRASTRFGPVYNPATGEQQAQVALAELGDVDVAVAAARKAFDERRDVSLTRRARIMFALRDLVERHIDELSEIIADQHGKVVSDAKGEVTRGMEVFEYACGIPTLLKGEYSEQVSTDVDAYSFRQPRGVCGGSRRSTSWPWCRCGCTPSRSPPTRPH